jgi:GDP-L-fucose synthase
MAESADRLDLTGKRILVTGGAGFLGSHIVEALEKRGCRHIAIPRRAEYDLTRGERVQAAFETFRPEVVIHCAALVGGILSNRDNPGRFFYENGIMGMQVIEACRAYGVEKAVVLGTICSYPKRTPVPFREESLWDGYPDETNAPYGIAKKALLVQCRAYREQYGLNAIFLMPSNLYGPRDHFDLHHSHVIPALIRKFVEARERRDSEVELWGSGDPTRDFLFVEDAAEAVVAATERYNAADPVNIGTGEEISIRDLARRIASLVGVSARENWDAAQPDGQPRRLLDVGRAERAFGFRARTRLEDGLRITIDWYTRARVAAVS